MENYTKSDVIKGMIYSCENMVPTYFSKYLFSENVFTDFPTKDKFFEFYTLLIESVSTFSKPPLVLKIKTREEESRILEYYTFYDGSEKYERLVLILEHLNNKQLLIDILPF